MIKSLIFVHGWASRPEIWERQKGYFAKDYEVILPDISEAQDIKEAAALLADGVRDKSGFVLIGWSLGWLVVLEGLKNFALKPQGLVAVNSTAKFTSDDYLGIGPSDTHLAKMIRDCKQNPKKTLEDFYKSIFTPLAKNSIANIEFKNINYNKLIYGLYMLRDCDYRDFLPELNVPALIIAGQADKITPLEASLYMQRKIRASELNPDFALGFEENGLNPCQDKACEQKNRSRIRCNTARTLLRAERSSGKDLETFCQNPNANSGLKVFDCGHMSFLEQEEEFNSIVGAFLKKL